MLARLVSEILSLDIDPLVKVVTRKLLVKLFIFSMLPLFSFFRAQTGRRDGCVVIMLFEAAGHVRIHDMFRSAANLKNAD